MSKNISSVRDAKSGHVGRRIVTAKTSVSNHANKSTAVGHFVKMFYAKHGKVMSRLANE